MRRLATAVTALKFIPGNLNEQASKPYLLAGLGNQVHIYAPENSKSPITIQTVFPPDVRIHGFSDVTPNDRIIAHGGRNTTLLQITRQSPGGPIAGIRPVLSRTFPDWIWNISFLTALPNLVIISGGHSLTWISRLSDLSTVSSLSSDREELTWSATAFLSQDASALHTLSATSFGEVLISTHPVSTLTVRTTPPHKSPTHGLNAHQGAITQLTRCASTNLLACASVDRTLSVWKPSKTSTCAACAPSMCFTPLVKHYGHSARVWHVAFLSDERLVSVSEDGSVCLWSARSPSSPSDHSVLARSAGNVWVVATHSDQDGHSVCTGGDDSCVHFTHVPARGRDAGSAVRQITCHLPHSSRHPRKVGQAHDESARCMVLGSSSSSPPSEGEEETVVITTDFGRILHAGFVDGDLDKLSSIELAGDATSVFPMDGGGSVRWSEVFRDASGVAFTPAALLWLDGFLCAGRSDGCMIVAPVRSVEGALKPAGRAVCVEVLRGSCEMVMGLFAGGDRGVRSGRGRGAGSGHDLFAACPNGHVYHWRIFVETSEGGEYTVRNSFIALYQSFRSTKSALVTCLTFLKEVGIVLVGDKGGRVHAFHTPDTPGSKISAAAWLNVHADRVSCMEGLGDSRVLTCGFDGSVSTVRLHESLLSGEALGGDVQPLVIERTDRVSQRFDTIVKLFVHGSDILLAAFRGAVLKVCHLHDRADLLRLDVGNWRRAHDVSILSASGVTTIFWRAGRLHIARSRSRSAQDALLTAGCEFHAGRANSLAWIGDMVFTGGEDTAVRRTILDARFGLSASQRLDGHVSGVNCVASLNDDFLLSGGGGDEIIAWGKRSAVNWCKLWNIRVGPLLRGTGNSLSMGAGAQSAEGLEMVMRITAVSGGTRCETCTPRRSGHAQAAPSCSLWMVGRSDGLVAGLHVRGCDDVHAERVGARCDGAVLSLCVLEEGRVVVIGDSAGGLSVRKFDGTLVQTWGQAHEAGVNCLGVRAVGGKVVIASGGDDERVRVWVVGSDGRWESGIGCGHRAAVTGLTFVGGCDDLFVTCGADQRVLFWKVMARNNGGVGDFIVSASVVFRALSCVPDLAGVSARFCDDVRHGGDGDERTRRRVLAVVCGHGLEVINGPDIGD